MAEEDVVENKTEETETEVVEENTEVVENPIDQLAIKLGWNPNYDGADRKKLTAEEFILKSKEIQNTSNKQIKKYSREVAELRNGLQALESHYESLYGAQIMGLKQKLTELKRQRKEANTDGNNDLVRELDGQIDEIEKVPVKPPQKKTNFDPVFTDWLDTNEWYENDEDLRGYADMLGEKAEYKALFETKGYKAMLDKVGSSVKKMFPEKFGDPNASSASDTKVVRQVPPVESSQRRSAPGKTKLSYKDLPRSAQDSCDTFVKLGVMTVEKYLEDYETKINAS